MTRRSANGGPGPGVVGRSGEPRTADGGSATVEFVLLALVLVVPLMYLAIAVSAVQRTLYGVTHAAREAGRAYSTGGAAGAAERAAYAAELALADQGLPAGDLVVRYGPADRGCASASPRPWPLAPGAVFAVCVTRSVAVPGVPGLLAGSENVVTGRYVVHADEFREYALAPVAHRTRLSPDRVVVR